MQIVAAQAIKTLQEEAARKLARQAAESGAGAVQRQAGKALSEKALSEVASKGESVLQLLLGKDLGNFLTRSPLPQNIADQGPNWLKRLTQRLDGRKYEGIGLKVRAGAQLPTPLPGLTLLADASTEATLRRNPKGLLELVYATELGAGAAAELRAGLSAGFSLGQVNLQAGAIAQAGAEAKALERMMLVYEVNPKVKEEMFSLGKQLKGQIFTDAREAASEMRPGLIESLVERFKGQKALAKRPEAPSQLTSEFARKHLSQASFYQGVRVGGRASGSAGVGFNRDGVKGIGGNAFGMGLDLKKEIIKVDELAAQGWQKSAGVGTDLINALFPPSARVGGAFDVGIERTLDFDRGKYLQTTVALNSDRALYAGAGAWGPSIDREFGTGHRYAVTYGPEGLKGVDYSVKLLIKDALKEVDGLKKQMPQIESLLPKSQAWDDLVLTYSLKPHQLDLLKGAGQESLEKELPRIFASKDRFGLTRAMSYHDSRMQVGGWIGMGLGPFVGGKAYLSAEYEAVGLRLGKFKPADPLPADRPWNLSIR